MRHTHVHELESSAASECRETFPGAEQASAVRARYGSVIFAANRHRRRRRPSAGSASIDEHDEDTKFGVMSASEEPQEVKPAPPKERRFKLSR